jgi:hypothetical protein
MTILAVVALLCAAGPAILFVTNLKLYRPPNRVDGRSLPAVSVLIPARNEEAGIAAAVECVLASEDIELEVIVMDDASTDRTAEIVRALALRDSRVRLEKAPPLPAGWNGKQHACWALANVARHDLLCFADADVRLAPVAVARMAAFLLESNSALVSGFPRQVTLTWLEWLLLPLIHFVLLGFLPLGRMRASKDPAFAAGCGQFVIVTRESYFFSGGHSKIRLTMHDGLLLPRLIRAHGYQSDLADITEVATCRMYHSAAEVWQGLAKNATEGLAAPARIVPVTVLLLAGQMLPLLILIALTLQHHVLSIAGVCAVVAAIAAWLPRAIAVRRFRQPVAGAVLHPVGILVLLGVQWYAFGRKQLGGTVRWKSRDYAE